MTIFFLKMEAKQGNRYVLKSFYTRILCCMERLYAFNFPCAVSWLILFEIVELVMMVKECNVTM